MFQAPLPHLSSYNSNGTALNSAVGSISFDYIYAGTDWKVEYGSGQMLLLCGG